MFAADHGITDEGVSAYPREVTQQMVRNFLAGGAAINVLARQTGSDIVVVDVGSHADFEKVAGLLHRKVRRGTRNFARVAAMTEAELNAALQVGISLAAEANAQGRTLIALGEMGIGNTSAATAIAAALSGQPVLELTGRGTGLDEQRRVAKSQIIDKALRFHFGDFSKARPARSRCWPASEDLRSRRLLAWSGAAAHRIAVVIDGFICSAGAAIACAIAPHARGAVIAGHLSQEYGSLRVAGKHQRETNASVGYAAGRRHRRGPDLSAH